MITQQYVNDVAYKHLGPGLLESVYETCMIDELSANGLTVYSQLAVPVIYKEKQLGNVLKLDLLVNDLVIVELKSVDAILPIFKAQLLSYLKLSGRPKGLLINFNCENISKEGLIPLVTEEFSKLQKNSLVNS